MSSGIYVVVDAINAIGAAALAADKQVMRLLGDATAAKSAKAGISDSGGDGSGAASPPPIPGAKGWPDSGVGATVLTPAQLGEYLRALEGRVQK